MHEKLDEIEKRYEELQRKIEDPSIVTDVAAEASARTVAAATPAAAATKKNLRIASSSHPRT